MAPKRRSSASSEQRQLKSQRRSSGSSDEGVAEHVEIVKKVQAVVIPKLDLPDIVDSQPQSAFSARRSAKQQYQLLQQNREDPNDKDDEQDGIETNDDDDDDDDDDEDDDEQIEEQDDQVEEQDILQAINLSISQQQHVEQNDDDDTFYSTQPISAIAARRLARQRLAEQQQLEQEDSNLESSTQFETDAGEGSPVTETEEAPVVSVPKAKRTPTKKTKKQPQPKPKEQKKSPAIDKDTISIFEPSSENVVMFKDNDEEYLALGLQEKESIVFVGKALVAVYHGAVRIMGNTLAAESEHLNFYPVFSFRTHALLRIEPTTQIDNVPTRTTDIQEDRQPFVNAFQKLEHFAAVIVIRTMEWCGFDDLERVYGAHKDMARINGYYGHRLMPRITGFYPIFVPMHGVKSLDIPSTWSENVNTAIQDEKERGSPLVSVVCGVQNSGKSTFSRYLVNTLLNSHKRVAYLETDVGQTEFTPAGIVALHVLDSPILGPPFTHQNLQSKRSHYFGAKTAENDPSYYMRIVRQLISTWQHDYNDRRDIDLIDQVPLVVNTHGWIRGLGYDLLAGTIHIVEPTNIFAAHGVVNSFPPTFATDILPSPDAKIQPKLHYIENPTLTGANRVIPQVPSRDFRDLTFICYMHQDLTHFGQLNKPWWNFKTNLLERLPWSLDWRTGLDSGIWVLSQEVKLNHLLYALNASIVALISSDSPSEDYNDDAQSQDMDQESPNFIEKRQTENNIIPPKYMSASGHSSPDPEHTHCHGLAIVRAIDPSEHTLLMLTPEVRSTVNKVSGLVKGNMDIPLHCMVDQFGRGTGVAQVPWRQVPYLTKDAITGAGGSQLKIKRINKRGTAA
ncbi:hypothetical protein K492DRAFT_164701 [Lichtheimia hyalospora FSU 10163]|nr:hypothetical protein K492DRAFT_164701 [Lichtheimia hyalospora FSU 10163]